MQKVYDQIINDLSNYHHLHVYKVFNRITHDFLYTEDMNVCIKLLRSYYTFRGEVQINPNAYEKYLSLMEKNIKNVDSNQKLIHPIPDELKHISEIIGESAANLSWSIKYLEYFIYKGLLTIDDTIFHGVFDKVANIYEFRFTSMEFQLPILHKNVKAFSFISETTPLNAKIESNAVILCCLYNSIFSNFSFMKKRIPEIMQTTPNVEMIFMMNDYYYVPEHEFKNKFYKKRIPIPYTLLKIAGKNYKSRPIDIGSEYSFVIYSNLENSKLADVIESNIKKE